ncbi:MAG: prolyl oligopeptidase family serine peptidase [Candidatus Poribacteria bacterium]
MNTSTGQRAHIFKTQIMKTVRLNYLLFLPKGYGQKPQQRWPLILFLHGAGERGDDIELVKKHGIPKIVEKQDDFPFIALSPQCPKSSWWTVELEALNALLDEIVATYAVDTDRIYLTGLSMGGYGAWHLATAYPERFAAIAPICGGGDPEKACVLKDVPVWVFHGARDETVSPEESEKMVNALKDCGGDVQFTLYPNAGHDSWTETYDNPELYKWFLKHTRHPAATDMQPQGK